jgi:hypothetical protein
MKALLRDMESKFTDEEIQDQIYWAQNSLPRNQETSVELMNAHSNLALAMVAYNEMIDRRWERYYGDKFQQHAHVLIKEE